MNRTIFLAGASGAIGQALIPLLLADGWQVTGTTRSAQSAERLAAQGITPAILDIYDAEAVRAALLTARPTILMHQLTALPPGLDPARMPQALQENARIREEGTRILLAPAQDAGVQHIVAQSIAFAYAPGPKPYAEDAPLDTEAEGIAGVSTRGVASLERQVLTAPIPGCVLRYGFLYGPGTGMASSGGPGALHVHEAATTALLAATLRATGIFNIAEPGGDVRTDRAREILGWPSTPG